MKDSFEKTLVRIRLKWGGHHVERKGDNKLTKESRSLESGWEREVRKAENAMGGLRLETSQNSGKRIDNNSKR